MNIARKYISTYATARRLDVDPRTLIRLVNQKVVKPQRRLGDRMLFAEDCIEEIRSVVNSRLERAAVLI